MSQDEDAQVMEDRHAARERLKERLVPEVETALLTAPDVRPWPRDWKEKGEIDFFYRSSTLLARDVDLPRVRSVLDELGALAPEPDHVPPGQDRSTLINGLSRVTARVPESKHTMDVLEDVDRRLGLGVTTPDHAFVVAYVAVCPASEPEQVLAPEDATASRLREVLWPPPGDPAAGRDVRVAVVDTGLLQGAAGWAPWIQGVRPNSSEDIDHPDQLTVDSQRRARDGYADPYAGHGTFVSGVLRCVAPACDVTVERVLDPAGFAYESNLTKQINDALTRSPDLISMSAGGSTRGNIPPLSFQRLYEDRLSQLGGVTLIAAAGNDGSTKPFWPAAFPWCVGVGSMSRDGTRRSPFSNYGSWVDVYAPGEDIVNAYARMKYKTVKDADVRDTSAGVVRWSGTSFATPIVAGLVAGRMSRTGENAATASAALLAAARGQFRPGVGPRLFP